MKKSFLPQLALLAYSIFLLVVMVFKAVPAVRVESVTLDFGGTNGDNPANFIPFRTIVPYVLGEEGALIGGLNLLGNILLLVPVGFLLPWVYRSMNLKKSLALGVFAGLAVEGTQVMLRVGIFDIDDVLLNAFGVVVGYVAFLASRKWIGSFFARFVFAL